MLEGYTALGFVAGRTERLRLRLLVTGVTYRHPGAAGQDRHDARRPVGRAGRAGHRRRLVRARAPRPRRAVPAARRALRAARGGDPDLPADVERRRRPVRRPALPARRDAVPPAPVSSPRPADHDRRRRRAEDAAPRRAVRRRLQHLRRSRRGGAQARRAPPPLRRRRPRPERDRGHRVSAICRPMDHATTSCAAPRRSPQWVCRRWSRGRWVRIPPAGWSPRSAPRSSASERSNPRPLSSGTPTVP